MLLHSNGGEASTRLGVARANTAVGVSPKTFLLLLLHTKKCKIVLVALPLAWPVAACAAPARHDKQAMPDYSAGYVEAKKTRIVDR
jgi:hypothetical protein